MNSELMDSFSILPPQEASNLEESGLSTQQQTRQKTSNLEESSLSALRQTPQETSNPEAADLQPTLQQTLVALLFAAKEPLTAKELGRVAGAKSAAILAAIDEINQAWATKNDPLQIEKAGDTFVLKTRPAFRPLIDKLHKGPIKERLSKATLEVLAIILHKEPVARSAIEQLRGVDCLPILQALLDRGLIETESSAENKLTLYKTTKRFLSYFSLPSKEVACAVSPALQGSLQEPDSDS